jgi:hypothetical protein
MSEMKDKPRVQNVLETLFGNAVETLMKGSAGGAVSALHVQVDLLTGELQIYDGNETLLEKNVVFEWAESDKALRSYRQAAHYLGQAIASLKNKRFFDNDIFELPLKILLVDENFNEIEHVLTVEDPEMTISDGRLLKNFEHDLQDFYKKLFAD